MEKTVHLDAAQTVETAANGPKDIDAGAFRVVERVMLILGCLSKNPSGITLTELSQETGIHKATASRFLKALERGGFVSVALKGKTWQIGPALVEIGARAQLRTDIREVARPIIGDACQETNETIQLAVLADDGISYIEKVEPPEQSLRINSQVGSRRPLHCTGLGKVLAAFHHDPTEIDRILKATGMRQFTPQTITSLTEFHEEMARIRCCGYAIDDREYNELVTCVAAPIRDASGTTVAGLSVSAIGVAIDSHRFREFPEIITRVALRVSEVIGFKRVEA